MSWQVAEKVPFEAWSPWPREEGKSTAAELLAAEVRKDAMKEPKSYVINWEVRGGGE